MNKLMKGMIWGLLFISASVDALAQTNIKMRKQGNVFILPCKVNGLALDMFFDTGADDVSISLTEANYMFSNGFLKDDDVKGKQSFRTAEGGVTEGTRIIIRKITFAGLELNDVEATIMPNMDAPLLLGQSAIKKLGKIQLDFETNTLTVFIGKGDYDYSKTNKIGKPGFEWDASGKDNKSGTVANKTSDADLKEVMTLKIDRPGGANGGGVAWHPGQKKYYAAQAGNASFPLEVFDEKGNMVSGDNLETMVDVRGFWYNPNTKKIQATSYDNKGWSEYVLDARGIPTSVKKILGPSGQPDAQSAGAYDPKNNMIYFYDLQTVGLERHKLNDGGVESTIKLHLGAKTREEINEAGNEDIKYNYSENVVVYTGIAKSEIGILNVSEKRIELYNIATGLMTSALKLPDDAPVAPLLNFSYANGIYWLFDKVERVWHGYKGTAQ